MKYKMVHLGDKVNAINLAALYQEEDSEATILLCKKKSVPLTDRNEISYKIYRLQNGKLDGPVDMLVNANLRNYMSQEDMAFIANTFENILKKGETTEDLQNNVIVTNENDTFSGEKVMIDDNNKPEQSSPNMAPRKCSEALTAYYNLYRSTKVEEYSSNREKDEQKLGDNRDFLSSMIFND